MKQLSCAQCRARWDELISQSTFEADGSETAEVAAHLESCAECRKAFDLLSAARQEMRQLPAQTAPASLRANIRSQITQQPGHTWLASFATFFRSPQRLAWAGSAALAVFLVAFLMRPERQKAVLQDTPKVLSNRDQVILQNQQHANEAKNNKINTPPQASSPKPEMLSPQPAPQPETKRNPNAPAQQQTAPPKRPRLAPKTKTPPPAPKPESQTTVAPQPPKPVPPTSGEQPAQEKEAEPPAFERYSAPPAATSRGAEDTSSSSPAPAPEQQTELTNADRGAPAPAQSAKGPSGPPVSNRMRLQKVSPEIISWRQQITATNDVAHAEIYAKLDPALSFANTPQDNASQRLVWKGALQAGQKITIALSLRMNEKAADQEKAFVHLTAVDADNQKVLWDDKFEVNRKTADQ